MTLRDLLFDTDVDQTSIVINDTGAHCGGTTKQVKYIGDVENKISIGTAGIYAAKDIFKDSSPYYREYSDGVLIVLISYHFLVEVRRQMSGDVLLEDSKFSPAEELFYSEYIKYINGDVKEGEVLLAVDALDKWFVDEIQVIPHPELNRTYSSTHKWMKLQERE